MEEDGEERLYLVAETKGSMDLTQLRQEESEKVFCAKRHFEAVGNKVQYKGIVDNYLELQRKIVEN
jgi:type III restriction enzyme